MKTEKGVKQAALFLMLLVFVAGCSQKAPPPVEKIVLGLQEVVHLAPFWIAEHNGYFKEEALQVETKNFDSGRTALRTMLNTEGIDLVTAAQSPVIFNSFTRDDYAIIGAMVFSENDDKILARRDKGISAPADLKGKTVGITRGSAGHFFLDLFLPYNRLQMSDVHTIDMEPPRLSQALIQGQADAIVTWEPHIYEAMKALGDKALLFPSSGLVRKNFYFIARKAFIKTHPEALKRFLRNIEKGEAIIQSDREKAIAIVGQRLKMDLETVKAIWEDLNFRLFLDQPMLTSMEDEARWAIRNKLTNATSMPNYLEYIHSAALKAVNPGAISIAGR